MPRISRCRLLCKSLPGTPYAAISRLCHARHYTHSWTRIAFPHQRSARYSGLVFISVIALGANLRDPEEKRWVRWQRRFSIKGSFPRTVCSRATTRFRLESKMSADTFAPGDDATASFSIRREPQDPDGDENSIRRQAARWASSPSIRPWKSATERTMISAGQTCSRFSSTGARKFEKMIALPARFTLQASGAHLRSYPATLPAGAQLAGEILLAEQTPRS